jgi:hypothetical protein
MMSKPQSTRVTPEVAGEYLGVAKDTLTVWRCTQRYPIPYYKIGRKVYYDLRDLDEFLESRKVGGPRKAKKGTK